MKQLKFRLKKIESLPTLSQSQCDDLKLETQDTRVWLSRMTIEDGMPYNNQVTIEKYQHPAKYLKSNIGVDQSKPKVWITVRQYEAR